MQKRESPRSTQSRTKTNNQMKSKQGISVEVQGAIDVTHKQSHSRLSTYSPGNSSIKSVFSTDTTRLKDASIYQMHKQQ